MAVSTTLIRKHVGSMGRFRHFVRETHTLADASMETFIEEARADTRTLTGAKDTLVCVEAIGEKKGGPDGDAQVRLMFRTRTTREWLQDNINRLEVFRQGMQTAQPREYDRSQPPHKIQGFDDANPFRWWRIKQGENRNLRPKEALILRGFVNDLNQYISPLDTLVDTVNAGDMTGIHPNGTAGTLLYTHKIVRPEIVDSVWEVEIHMIYHHEVWNSQCVMEQWHNEQRRVGALAEDGTALPSNAYRVVTVPARTGTSAVAKLCESTAGWAYLQNMVTGGS